MSCPSCAPAPEACVTVYPVQNPCDCDSPAGIEEIGPTGTTGPRGFTPQFSIGTVGSGDAFIEVISTGYATREINLVLPAVPEGVPYTWTEVNTFAQKSNFEQGLETTGGESIFGGISLTVTPDATFSGNVAIEGNSTIAGDLDLTTILNVTGNMTVDGDTLFNDIEFLNQWDLTQSTFPTLPNASGYVGGKLVLGSCLNLERQPNVGSALFSKSAGANLVAISPVDNGPICDPLVINVPVSACMPQVTPLVDIRVRVGYRFVGFSGFGLGNNFNAEIEQVAGAVQIDFYTQGDGVWNAAGGFFELRGQATLVAGNNSFNVNVTNNDASSDFTPSSVTFWVVNTN